MIKLFPICIFLSIGGSSLAQDYSTDFGITKSTSKTETNDISNHHLFRDLPPLIPRNELYGKGISVGYWGISVNYEINLRKNRTDFYVFSAEIQKSLIYEDDNTFLLFLDLGFLRHFKKFKLFEDDNSFYYRLTLGIFMGKSILNPTYTNPYIDEDSSNSKKSSFVSGLRFDYKLGFSINYAEYNYISIELGLAFIQTIQSRGVPTLYIGPELRILHKNYIQLFNW